MTDEILNDDIPAMIVPMILLKLKSELETALQIEVPESDPTRAVVVKIGRFQENPLNKNISIALSGGDYEDPTYLDGPVNNPEFLNDWIKNLPVGEIGGGQYWFRRGTAHVQTFYVRQRYPEEVAMQYAYDFYGRVIKCLETVSMSGLRDDYREGAFGTPIVEGTTFFESGGKDRYIWRGKLLWRVLTWRP